MATLRKFKHDYFMKKFKMKALLISLFTLTSICAHAEPQGWGVGLGLFDSDIGIQARKGFVMGPELQYEAVLQGGLYNQNKFTARFDADFHYVFPANSTARFYPLVGFDWAIRSKDNRAGVNLGGGANLDLNLETSLFIEAKYVASDWDGFAFTVGIYF
jgi:hypothetical protein